MRRHHAVASVLALAVSAAVLLAGCSGSSTERSGPDAIVRVGLVLEPTSLDIRTQSGAALDQVLIDNVYQGLVGRTATGKIRDVLASRHTVSADGLTYTFMLRKNVSFQNGDAVTATVVAESLNDFKSHADSYIDGDDFASVKDIAGSGDEVVISMRQPDSDLLWNLTGRAGLVLDASEKNDRATSAVGTGPFRVSSWKQGDALALTRSETYWGPKAGVGGIVFRYIPDPSTAVNAMANGDLDVETAVDGTLRSQLENTSGIALRTGKTTDKYTLAFNDHAAPFNDIRVRKAVRQAIDPKAVIKAVGGNGVEQGGPIPALDPGFEDLTSIDPYDPSAARRLLADAGQPKLTLSLTYANVYPTAIGDVLKSELAQVGITLNVRRVDFATWLDQVYKNKRFEMSMVNHTEARDFGNWANPKYYFGYDNAAVQQLYAASLATTDQRTKDAKLAEAARMVSEDAAGEWLYTATTTTAIRSGVSGFPTNSTTTRLNLSGLSVK